MLIPVGKLKLAYELSQTDVDALMDKLLPDKVFPLVLWETAYNEYWLWSLKSNSQCYHFDIPQLPNTGPLPKKYFTYSLHSNLIEGFFRELIRKAKIGTVEKGLSFIIECSYEEGSFPFKEEMNALFASLYEEERTLENWQRKSGPLIINFIASTNYGFISNILFDSIAVDKHLSVRFLEDCGYKLQHEVKGITRSLVDSIIKKSGQAILPSSGAIPAQDGALTASPNVTFQEKGNTILIPRYLWEDKEPQEVCNDMRVAGYIDDAPIAHALYYWCGIKNFTQIGTILRGNGIGDSARKKHAQKKLKEAEGRYRTE